MRLRRVVSVWVLAGVFVVGLMAPGPAAGQAASADAKTGSALRTPWGDPDLQGVWTGSTLTPLQRPQELAGKAFLTERGGGCAGAAGRSESFCGARPAGG